MNAPIKLRTEYRDNPLGIDSARPRFYWQSSDPRPGARQTRYRLVVDDLWDSGVVDSDASIHIEYAGPALRSRQRATWRVMTWDQDGVASAWSEPATFETALLDAADWQARWIAAPIVGGPYTSPPPPLLRKPFNAARAVTQARLYITALGLYDCEINGVRVGDQLFAPGRTEYARRLYYNVHDVTALINTGKNAIGVSLGDGWYCGHLHSDPRQTYGDRPKLLAQLELTFADGSRQLVCTDSSWRSGEGAVRSSDMLMGEDVDARLGVDGWTLPEFDDSTWRSALLCETPPCALQAAPHPPIRVQQVIRPVGPPVASANKRRHIFDLGQNMVGHVRLRVRDAKRGHTLSLRHVEMLDEHGKPYTTALRSARATDHYTARGDAVESFEPKYTFHGFRYVEVRDYPGRNPTADDLEGIVVHSDCEPAGTFECSDHMINQLQRNIVWSQRGNFLDIPTDCPQRDERLGWTGDAQVFIRTAAFNMNIATFFAKWLADMADTQALHGDGRIHSVVPGVTSIHHEGGPAWSDAAVICPWVLYQCYGDRRTLETCWPMMSWFMKWLADDCGPSLIRCDETKKWKGYGDWLNQDAVTPPDLIGTAFYAYCADLMSRMASVLSREDESKQYRDLFGRVRAAFRGRFMEAGRSKIKTQTAHILALHMNLAEPAERAGIEAELVADIASRQTHLSTGFVGTPYLNHVLSAAGRDDVAFALLMQKTFPSWLFPITHGATTMWERWDGWTPEKGFNDAGMNSYNHYAFGAVGEWIYKTIGGIDLDHDRPAYKHIHFRPTPGGGITWARTSLETLYGKVECNWKQIGDEIDIELLVPGNTTATLHVGGRNLPLAAGRHRFREKMS
jgi:alpha-L-rhamnosidase